ncbi:MAG TPA: polysaccharide biosynthesis C-terminal domain-containing protein [Planctomycetota bacterium]|nr:polysaccharide biosynthesis C-terminal domain-containing protein [Planctomycetota bacterium]
MPGAIDRKVVAGTALQAGGRLVTAAIAFGTVVLLADRLPRDAFGRFGATLALLSILDALVDFGSLSAAVRRVAHEPSAARAVVRAATRFRVVMAAIAAIALAAWAVLRDHPQAALVAIAGLGFFTHAAGMGVAVLHADIDYRRSEGFRVLGSALGFAGILALVMFGVRDAGSTVLAFCAGSAIANLALAASVRADLPPLGAGVATRSFVAEAVTLGAGAVVRQTYYSLNPLLADALAGPDEAARFLPAYRISGFAILVSVYASAAALPALARLRREDRGDLARFVRRWTLGLFAIGVSIALVLALASRPLIAWIFPKYADSAAVLAPMCITIAAIHVGGFALTRLVAGGRSGAVLVVSFVGLAANLATNFLLTPSLGAIGAAWASVATELTVAAGALVAIRVALRDEPLL